MADPWREFKRRTRRFREIRRRFAAAEKEFHTRVMLNGVLIAGDHPAPTSATHSGEDIDAVVTACRIAFAGTAGLVPRRAPPRGGAARAGAPDDALAAAGAPS